MGVAFNVDSAGRIIETVRRDERRHQNPNKRNRNTTNYTIPRGIIHGKLAAPIAGMNGNQAYYGSLTVWEMDSNGLWSATQETVQVWNITDAEVQANVMLGCIRDFVSGEFVVYVESC